MRRKFDPEVRERRDRFWSFTQHPSKPNIWTLDLFKEVDHCSVQNAIILRFVLSGTTSDTIVHWMKYESSHGENRTIIEKGRHPGQLFDVAYEPLAGNFARAILIPPKPLNADSRVGLMITGPFKTADLRGLAAVELTGRAKARLEREKT
jgi:hypothetical protein